MKKNEEVLSMTRWPAVLASALLLSLFTAPAAAVTFPLEPGQLLQLAGDYGPAGLFTDSGFQVDVVTGAMTPVPGYPTGGYRVAVSPFAPEMFVLSRIPNVGASLLWRLQLDTGMSMVFATLSDIATDVTVLGDGSPRVVSIFDPPCCHTTGVDASMAGVPAFSSFNPNLAFSAGFCAGGVLCDLAGIQVPAGWPGWGVPGQDFPRDVAWGYGSLLYVSTSAGDIQVFDVAANTWLGYHCQDCTDFPDRITVFTPVPMPSGWWLMGLGAALLIASAHHGR